MVGGWVSVPRASAFFTACALALGACSPYHEAHSVADLRDAETRVVLVEVVMERTSVSDQVTGLYLGSNLVADDQIPMDNGRPDFTASSGHEIDTSSFGSDGGVVAFGAGSEPLYLLGLRAQSTSFLFSTQTFMPFVTQIPRAKGRCEYIGTLHVWGPERFRVSDDFDAHRAKLVSAVNGCSLVTNLAKPVKLPPMASD